MIRRLWTFLGFVAMLFICVNITQASANESFEPGSNEDPLVSKSYVDGVLAKYTAAIKENEELKQRLNTQELAIKALQKDIDALKAKGGGGSGGYQVISLEAGKTLNMGLGAEALFRSGKATAVKGKSASLVDSASARELASGTVIPLNSLIVSPADDGCGIRAVSKSILLIRGSYKMDGQAVSNNSGTKTGTEVKDSGNAKDITKKGIINATVLNIREKPNASAKILTTGLKNETVEIISKEGQWFRIKTSKGVYGWSLGSFITEK